MVTLARKLSVLLHSLWITAEVYEPLRNTHRRQEQQEEEEEEAAAEAA